MQGTRDIDVENLVFGRICYLSQLREAGDNNSRGGYKSSVNIERISLKYDFYWLFLECF